MTIGRSLVTRLDSMADVLLAGPAISALAALGPVDILCSRRGAPAAALLRDVTGILPFDAAWVLRDAAPVDPLAIDHLVDRVSARRYARAAVLTSSHQSPLPMALLLRLAGVAEIAAVSIDHAGRLLDHRIPADCRSTRWSGICSSPRHWARRHRMIRVSRSSGRQTSNRSPTASSSTLAPPPRRGRSPQRYGTMSSPRRSVPAGTWS